MKPVKKFYSPRRIFTLFLIVVFWLLLSGNFSLTNVVVGTAVSLVTVTFFINYLIHKHAEDIGVLTYFKKFLLLLLFSPVFFYQAYKASLQVLKLIFTSTKNLESGFVEVKTDAPTISAVSMLANLITLTPGTITVDYSSNKNCYYVHWIQITEKNDEDIREEIIGPFEPWIRRIFG